MTDPTSPAAPSTATPPDTSGAPNPGFTEFVILVAALMTLNAFGIDVMLPALGLIGDAFGVPNPNDAQRIIVFYIMSMGFGQLVFGPLADRFGRRPVALYSLAAYCVAALAAMLASSFALVIVARIAQGFAAAGARVIAVSLVRDRYSGRAMSRVMSLAIIVFMAAPVLAPGIGSLILLATDSWRAVLGSLFVLGLGVMVWSAVRLPETLAPENRRPIKARSLLTGYGRIARTRQAAGYMAASGFVFGALFGFIASANQILLDVFNVGAWFPVVFGAVALGMAGSNFVNSQLVERIGMRRLSHGALVGFVIVNAAHALAALAGFQPLAVVMSAMFVSIFLLGLMGSNFTALSLEPLGDMAGTAASVQGFISTVFAGALGGIVGAQFDGTAAPMAYGFFVLSACALATVLLTERGRLFSVGDGH